MQASPLPELRKRSLTFVPLCLATALALALLMLDVVDSGLLGRVLAVLSGLFAGKALVVLAALAAAAVVAVLVSPLLRAHLRLAASKVGRKLHFDTKTARDLRARLVDFENAADLTSLARLYLDAGRTREALPLLARAFELEGDHARTAWLFGRALDAHGQPQQAAMAFEAALARDPDIGFGEGLLDRGRNAVRLHDAEAARWTAEAHERRNGPTLQNLWLQAEAARIAGDATRREAILRRALEVAGPSAAGAGPEDAICLAQLRAALRSVPKGGAQ